MASQSLQPLSREDAAMLRHLAFEHVSGHLDTQKFNQLSSSLVERVGEEALHKLCVEIARRCGFTIMAWAHKTGLMELRAKRQLGFLGQTGGRIMLKITNPDVRESIKEATKAVMSDDEISSLFQKVKELEASLAAVTAAVAPVAAASAAPVAAAQPAVQPIVVAAPAPAPQKEVSPVGKVIQDAYNDCSLPQKTGVVGVSVAGAVVAAPIHAVKHAGLFIKDTAVAAASHTLGILEDTAATYREFGSKTTLYFKPEARALVVNAANGADPAKVYADTGLSTEDINAIGNKLMQEMTAKAKLANA